MQLIRQPYNEIRAGDWLLDRLVDGSCARMQIAVAFVQVSGIVRLETALRHYLEKGGTARFVVGVDRNGTSYDGLRQLLSVVGANGEVWVLHNPNRREQPIFHPKTYLFESDDRAEVMIGSNNLTKGGLFTNYEASIALSLRADQPEEASLWAELRSAFDEWCAASPICLRLDDSILSTLLAEGLVQTEANTRISQTVAGRGASDVNSSTSIFKGVLVRSAPKSQRRARLGSRLAEPTEVGETEGQVVPVIDVTRAPVPTWFGVTALYGDLPMQGSSYEIRITKGIRDAGKSFWGWRDLFEYDAARGQYTRRVRLEHKGEVINAYLKDFPAHKPSGTKASADFRIGSIRPIVQSLKEENDLIIFEQTALPDADYRVTVVSRQDRRYPSLLAEFQQSNRARSPKTGTYRKYRYG